MNRPLSPIRHDYKPSATPEAQKPKALPWFAAGLGLPLVGIALMLTLARSPAHDPTDDPTDFPTDDPVDVPAAAGPAPAAAWSPVTADDPVADPSAIELDAEDVEDILEFVDVADGQDDAFHPPLALPPEYAKLELTIRRGDTLDRLFRRNDLDLGDLAAIARLP